VGDVVLVQQLNEREVVADHGALEAPPVAQHVRQQVFGGGARHPVHVGVVVHHGVDGALADGHLEGRQQHVLELAAADMDGSEVAARLRRGIADEVLQGRRHAGDCRPLT
jgi:hypothetical protein